jgi:acyl-coenzyme A thioesterase PaaI-like protein
MADIGASEFDSATAMTGSVDDAGRGRYTGELLDGWDIGGNANGGYLLALAARAMTAASGRPHPISITAHYLAPGRPGPVTATTGIVKAGKRFTTVTGSLIGADDREIIRVLGTFGDVLAGAGEREFVHGGPPDLPPFDECVRRMAVPGGAQFGLGDRLNSRIDPATVPTPDGVKSGVADMRGWFEFADGRPSDPLALMLAADAFAPAVFHLELPAGWVPTLELTVHVRDVPAPGPLRGSFQTRYVTNGLFEEDGELWDSAGRLVAISRQLALVARAT